MKLRDFHFRILNRCLTTNLVRSKYEKLSSNCSFCNDKVETVYHLFYQCSQTKALWTAFNRWISKIVGEKISVSKTEIMFNEYKGTNGILVNLFILIMKRYIYVTKCKQGQLKFINFCALLHHVYKVELITAKSNEKISRS